VCLQYNNCYIGLTQLLYTGYPKRTTLHEPLDWSIRAIRRAQPNARKWAGQQQIQKTLQGDNFLWMENVLLNKYHSVRIAGYLIIAFESRMLI
jgi:hypothetical protein